jgi:hypothetical protein
MIHINEEIVNSLVYGLSCALGIMLLAAIFPSIILLLPWIGYLLMTYGIATGAFRALEKLVLAMSIEG